MKASGLRKSGPVNEAQSSGTGAMPQSSPVTANTVAREAPAHQSGTNTKTKDVAAFKANTPYGAKGHGGAA